MELAHWGGKGEYQTSSTTFIVAPRLPVFANIGRASLDLSEQFLLASSLKVTSMSSILCIHPHDSFMIASWFDRAQCELSNYNLGFSLSARFGTLFCIPGGDPGSIAYSFTLWRLIIVLGHPIQVIGPYCPLTP